MTFQLAAAKLSIKAAWATAKVWVFIVMVLAICVGLYFATQGALKRQKELEGLRTYRESAEGADRVRTAAAAAYKLAKDEHRADAAAADKTIVIHDRFTKEAANEDPATADFLSGRIPQRLRDADAAARRSGRLGTGAGRSDGAVPADRGDGSAPAPRRD